LLEGENTVHKANTQLWRSTIAKNGAENNIVSYQYIGTSTALHRSATSQRYIAKFCESLDRAAI